MPDVPGLDRSFDYLVPAESAPFAVPGAVVRVLLHGRRVRGWIEAVPVVPEAAPDRLRPLGRISSAGPPGEVVALTQWAAWRWAGPRALLLRAASPPNVVEPTGAGTATRRSPGPTRRSSDRVVEEAAAEVLSAARAVVEWPPASRMAELLRRLVAPEGSTIIVLPDAFRRARLVAHLERSGLACVVLSGEQDDAERTRAWATARSGGCVVVGGRVAAWAPVPDLSAAVVVDEADEAHKEERAPAWHARDVLAERAGRRGARLTLVTPVPTLEARDLAPVVVRPPRSRVQEGWGRVLVVDRGGEPPGSGVFTAPLVEALRRVVAGSGRAVCVLNRRGRARLLRCRECNRLAECEACGAALEEAAEGLTCAVCGATQPRVCGACGSGVLRRLRPGVARLAEELAVLLPRAGVAVVDAGTEGVPPTPVLVGTEAVLHRLERADLVAFLDFDTELLAPRYRAAEQALWLLVRAVRLTGPRTGGGTVLVQTRIPEHEVLQAALRGEPERFLEPEKDRRRRFGLPPFAALAEARGEEPAVAALVAALGSDPSLEVLGPRPGARGWEVLIRGPSSQVLCDALAQVLPVCRARGGLRVEVDPQRV